jgi:hypothetical protein
LRYSFKYFNFDLALSINVLMSSSGTQLADLLKRYNIPADHYATYDTVVSKADAVLVQFSAVQQLLAPAAVAGEDISHAQKAHSHDTSNSPDSDRILRFYANRVEEVRKREGNDLTIAIKFKHDGSYCYFATVEAVAAYLGSINTADTVGSAAHTTTRKHTNKHHNSSPPMLRPETQKTIP